MQMVIMNLPSTPTAKAARDVEYTPDEMESVDVAKIRTSKESIASGRWHVNALV
jgi:hypothetical protein